MAFRNIKTGKTLGAEFQESLRKFERFIENDLPDRTVEEAQKIVDESFERETYQNGKSSKWQERKNDDEASLARTERRALLVKSGKLIGDVNAERRGKDIIIGTDVPYAQTHNEGLSAGRGRKVKMPKRQFMPIPGESNPKLDKAIDDFIDQELDKIFK